MLLSVWLGLHVSRVPDNMASMQPLLRAAAVFALIVHHEVALSALEQWLPLEQEELGGTGLVSVRVRMLLQVSLPLQGLRVESAAGIHRVADLIDADKETSLLWHCQQRRRCGDSAKDDLIHGCRQLLLSRDHHESVTIDTCAHVLLVLSRSLARLHHLLLIGFLNLHI